MKAVLFKNPKSERESLYIQEDLEPHFYDILHFHPELQLTAIIKGEGTLFVGDKIDRFRSGEIFLLGPNLPHVFRNDPEYYEEDSTLKAHSVSIYFKLNSFGDGFFDLPEMNNIRRFLSESDRGLRISGDTALEIHQKIVDMYQIPGFEKIMSLPLILNRIANECEFEHISGMSYANPQKEADNQRINDTFRYVMNNFRNKITLEDVAEIAHMNVSSFSRFFKQRTRKTFSKFLNEVRIGNACRLLQTEKYSISEASYLSGYNNISNFNRQFKAIMGYTPRTYLTKMRK